MQICEQHAEKMRDAIEARGMTALVSTSASSAMEKTIDDIVGQHTKPTLDTFDPLLSMNWNICGNLLERLGQAGLYLLQDDSLPQDPIDVSRIADIALKAKYLGKTWPRCPVCYANIAHELSCTNPRCMLKRENGYDICIEWAADGVKQTFDELMAGKK